MNCAAKRDMDGDYANALLKRKQLEEEIRESNASLGQKSNMLHTLSKLWISVQNVRDTAQALPSEKK